MSPSEGRKRHSTKIMNRSFKDVEEFKCMRTTLTDQNYMHEEIKSRLNSGNACYQSLLSFRIPSKCLKIDMFKTIILPGALYGR
jgi:hypothetical protein